MKRWLFILGRLPDLGLAEALSALSIEGVQHNSERISKNILLVETDTEKSLAELLPRLGGTIKIAQVDAVLPRGRDSRAVLKEALAVDAVVRDYSNQPKGRWTFGISVYGAENDSTVARNVHDFGLDIKRYLKSRRRSARFVATRGKSMALSSVVVAGNGLLKEGGTEIVLVFGPDQLFRASTVKVQDFESYSNRDYGRPARNPKSGSLPPKLAQIMVNLAGQKPAYLIFDPFCGIGTVLQEALLMGYRVGGSDADPEQVQRSRDNLTWLAKQYTVSNNARLLVSPAEKVSLQTGSVDAVVTEGVLGPPRSQPYSVTQASQITRQIASLWKQTLAHWKSILKPGGTIVLTLPVLRTDGPEPFYTPLLDDLEALGYRLEALAPKRFTSAMTLSPRGTIIYDRPDQIVAREVCKLTRTHGT